MTTPEQELLDRDEQRLLDRAVRPGFTIHDILVEDVRILTPDADGVLRRVASGGRAAQTDLHRTYRTIFRETMQERQPRNKRRPMTYENFGKMFRKARDLGLVELVDREQLDPTSPAVDLQTIREGEVVPTTRNIYQLTDSGRKAGDEVWGDLNKAYRESTTRATPATGNEAALNEAEITLNRWRGRTNRNSVALTIDLEELEGKLGDAIDVSEATDALSDYQGLERSDFETQEEFSAERTDLWDQALQLFEDAIENARAELE